MMKQLVAEENPCNNVLKNAKRNAKILNAIALFLQLENVVQEFLELLEDAEMPMLKNALQLALLNLNCSLLAKHQDLATVLSMQLMNADKGNLLLTFNAEIPLLLNANKIALLTDRP